MLRSGSLLPVLLGFSLLIMSIGALHAAPSEAQWQALNKTIIEQHVAPRYQGLTQHSRILAESVQQYCLQPSGKKLTLVQSNFRSALDQWQSIQHVQFGPVTFLMRNHGMQYWPDKKNIGAKQLRAILAKTETQFDADFFRSASISLKGFPALERLLFNTLGKPAKNADHSCNLASAIAKHIFESSQAIEADWSEESHRLLNPSEEGYYETAAEAATEFMKSLVEPIEAIRDNKINKPLGKSLAQVRWKKSESWRSARSIQNIQANITSLHHLYSGTTPVSVKSLLMAEGEKAQAEQIDSLFSTVSQTISTLVPIHDKAVSSDTRQQLLIAADQLKTLQSALEMAMKTLNIQLGFNSRDGD